MSVVFFFKQKTAYELRISDWSSDVCSSDLRSQDFHSFENGYSAILIIKRNSVWLGKSLAAMLVPDAYRIVTGNPHGVFRLQHPTHPILILGMMPRGIPEIGRAHV